MQGLRIGQLFAVALVCASGCTDDLTGPVSSGLDAGAGNITADTGAASATLLLPDHCLVEDQNTQRAPGTLECTGLFASLSEKSLGGAVAPFTPAVPLWSDGAEKHRWLYLPPGTTIDTSNPEAWKFPVGTRAWKEFRHLGKRVETRFLRKVSETSWMSATYLWNADESGATNFAGGDVPVADGTYYVPTDKECEQCHRGSGDTLLGFQQVLLGLPGADGLNLTALVQQNRLSNPPTHTNYTIHDDGTGLAAPALGWLHVNCGVSCHNDTPSATGGPSRMYLRIRPGTLDDPTPAAWDTVKTTLDIGAHIANFAGRTRIVPGSAEDSLLVQLASQRGKTQMPPIATKTIDPVGIKAVRDWIDALGNKGGLDAGAPDTGVSVTVPPPVTVPPAVTLPVEDAGLPELDGGVQADSGVSPVVEQDASVPPAVVEDAAVPPVVVEPPAVAVTPPPVVEPPPVVTPPPAVEPPPVVAPPAVAVDVDAGLPPV